MKGWEESLRNEEWVRLAGEEGCWGLRVEEVRDYDNYNHNFVEYCESERGLRTVSSMPWLDDPTNPLSSRAFASPSGSRRGLD